MSEPLTDRARRYLASCKRYDPVSPERLRQLMIEQGIEPVELWLDFQENYAGYVEKIGADRAIWGIVHDEARCFPNPNPLLIDHYDDAEGRSVRCADVHGSYNYELAEDGRFLYQADRFEIHVEQLAAWYDFLRRHPDAVVKTLFDESIVLPYLAAETTAIAQASDSHLTYCEGGLFFGVKDTASGRWQQALIADPDLIAQLPPPKCKSERRRGLKNRAAHEWDLTKMIWKQLISRRKH